MGAAAVSCVADVPRLGGVRLVSGSTGKLSHACVGAWVVNGGGAWVDEWVMW